jgi:hypothetical protein
MRRAVMVVMKSGFGKSHISQKSQKGHMILGDDYQRKIASAEDQGLVFLSNIT